MLRPNPFLRLFAALAIPVTFMVLAIRFVK
jgi:hypothetical protein